MKLFSVVLTLALVLLGLRVLMGWGQRYDCGAPSTAALLAKDEKLTRGKGRRFGIGI